MNKFVSYAAAVLCGFSFPLAAQTNPPNNVFGVLIQHATDMDGVTSVTPNTDGKIAEGLKVHAAYQRLTDSTLLFDTTAGNPFYDALIQNGFKTVWTIVNRPADDGDPDTWNPASPPSDMAAYKQKLKDMVHRYNGTSLAALIQIENEPVADRFYSGTPAQYINQLQNAISAIHLASSNAKVTNGGLTNDPVCMITWAYLRDTVSQTRADGFGVKVMDSELLGWMPYLYQDFPQSSPTHFPGGSDEDRYNNVLQAWKDSDYMLTQFATPALAGLDYVNFHWYKKVDSASDTDISAALGKVIDVLQTRSGKPVVSTEMGQYDTSSAMVTAMMQRIYDNGQVPIVIWYDADGFNKTTQLPVDPNGLHYGDKTSATGVGNPPTLNARGNAFVGFITSHWP